MRPVSFISYLLCATCCAQGQTIGVERLSARFSQGIVGPDARYGVNYRALLREKNVIAGWLQATQKPLKGAVGGHVRFSGEPLATPQSAKDVEITFAMKIKVAGKPVIRDLKTKKEIVPTVGPDGYLVLPLQRLKAALVSGDGDRSIGFADLIPYEFSLQPNDRVEFRIESIKIKYLN